MMTREEDGLLRTAQKGCAEYKRQRDRLLAALVDLTREAQTGERVSVGAIDRARDAIADAMKPT